MFESPYPDVVKKKRQHLFVRLIRSLLGSTVSCPVCHGSKRISTGRCPSCEGRGRVKKVR